MAKRRLAAWAAAYGLAVALLGACGDDSSGVAVVVDPTSTNTPTQVQVGSVSRDPTGEASITPTPTEGVPNGDGGVELACNDILAPVNKSNSLPPECVPSGLVMLPDAYSYGGAQQLIGVAADAFIEMVEAAEADGHALKTRSSYRGYAEQQATFDYWVSTNGLEYAERTSARAGHSEHQLGTTADVTSESAGWGLEGFEGTAEARWLEDHAHEFGFVISYPDGSEPVTGYAYEPWHIRYVGREVAEDVRVSGKTLHEHLLGQ